MIEYEWPGKLIYNTDKGTITWRREQMAKEMKHKKEEMKKPAKSLKEKRMEKKGKKKDCM